MASALPVIAAHATGTTNLVRDGQTGILVDSDDIDGFADALESYARDPQLRRRHGAAGLTFAETMDWDTINSAVLKVYVKAIEKRKRLTRLKRRGLFRLFRA
jgi:glycosyltransferase involved in cell wall biosynthesis